MLSWYDSGSSSILFGGAGYYNLLMMCEWCNQEHNGSFGSGRFCNASCSARKCAARLKETKSCTDTSLMGKDSTRKKYLIKTREHECEICHRKQWNKKPIPLELDHIDGNSDNNKEENLRLVCLNCHAQTDSHAGKNARKFPGTKRHSLYKRLYTRILTSSG